MALLFVNVSILSSALALFQARERLLPGRARQTASRSEPDRGWDGKKGKGSRGWIQEGPRERVEVVVALVEDCGNENTQTYHKKIRIQRQRPNI